MIISQYTSLTNFLKYTFHNLNYYEKNKLNFIKSKETYWNDNSIIKITKSGFCINDKEFICEKSQELEFICKIIINKIN